MMILLFILLVVLYVTYRDISLYESFRACTGTDCRSCANQAGCRWCDQTQSCVDATTVKSTDSQCNLSNTIGSSFLCPAVFNAALRMPMKEEPLYQDQIADRVRPPNVYLTDAMEYTPETVMGNLNEVRQTLAQYQKELPDTISSSVEHSIQPMVKGLLSSYYQRECPE